jgi:uncharacterized protein (TIGR03000 family)
VIAAPAAPAAPKMDKVDEDKKGEQLKGKPKEDDEVRGPGPARVLVKAPADVVLIVNGQRVTRRTTEETYVTPTLQPGQAYAYRFQARLTRNGETITRSREIVVRTGRRAVVDFSDLGTRVAAR